MNICRALLLPILLMPATAFAAAELGQPAPNFKLPAADGKQISLADYKGKVVVLEWFNSGCPFVMNHYKSGHIQKLQRGAQEKGAVWLTVNSTAADHKDFLGPEKSAAFAKEHAAASAAFVIDADGKVGKDYEAKTTPHIFVIDKSGMLVYKGAIDDNDDPRADPALAKNYAQAALDEVLAGKSVTTAETKPYGCSVKFAE